MTKRAVERAYLSWSFLAPVFHRGYWLCTSLYLVVDAGLEPLQLVFIGTAQGITAIAMEVPTGVLADTVSRRLSLVVGHVLMATGMAVTGLVTAFPALVLTQMIWGLAWTFWKGADVAWLTDELDEPERTARVLTRAARFEQLGSATGLIAFGGLAWATSLSTAIVVSGLAMAALGLGVALGFREVHFTPAPRSERMSAAVGLFRRGVALARSDREILLVFAATVLINGAAEGFGRLEAKHLVALGLPQTPDPIVWLTALGLASLLLAALALRVVEAGIDGRNAAPRIYAAACAVGALGVGLFALAPDARFGLAGALLVRGIGFSVTRVVSVIWVNRRATSEVRATLQSFLAQAEYLGEIVLGISLGVVAQLAGVPLAVAIAASLLAVAGVLVVRSRPASPPAA
ncbi:MAG: MFS transporter [Myxococcota bacterium]|nr:MFS transporter [Myxococcota bacterium]